MSMGGRLSSWEESHDDGDEICDGHTGNFRNSTFNCNGYVFDNQDLDGVQMTADREKAYKGPEAGVMVWTPIHLRRMEKRRKRCRACIMSDEEDRWREDESEEGTGEEQGKHLENGGSTCAKCGTIFLQLFGRMARKDKCQRR